MRLALPYGPMAVAAGGLLLSCVTPTDHHGGTPTRPQIESIRFVSSPATGIQQPMLVLEALLSDGHQLQDGEYVPLEVTTNTGQAFAARILPDICEVDGIGLIVCDELLIALHPGRSIDDIDDLLNRVNGKLREWGSSRGGLRAIVRTFEGHLGEALQAARSHPAIRIGEYNHIVAGANSAPVHRAFVPTDPDLGPRRLALPVSPGDDVTARYANPDGTEVTATITVN